jgi:type IV fimbrial biogenesis protein FimT
MDYQWQLLDHEEGWVMLDVSLRTQSRQIGFTIIELALAITILAIVIALGVPSIAEWIQNSQIRTAAEGIKNGLQLARDTAVRNNAPYEFVLSSPGATGGTGWQVKAAIGGNVPYRKPNGEGSANAVVTTTPPTATTVTFSGLGRRLSANADATPVLTKVDIDSATLPVAQSRDLSITIGAGGEIRMCDPNVTDTGDPRKC